MGKEELPIRLICGNRLAIKYVLRKCDQYELQIKNTNIYPTDHAKD